MDGLDKEVVEQLQARWRRGGEDIAHARRGESREFSEGEMEAGLNGFDRRAFLKLMGASAALAGGAGLTGCSKPQPREKIVPYVSQPEGIVAGVARFYASAIPIDGWARGVIVEQHEGRPTKIEGNPDHPSSLGGTDIFTQASILELYDPDRATNVMNGEQTTTWSAFLSELSRFVSEKGGAQKTRVRVLTGAVTSPTAGGQLAALQRLFPQSVWHQHEAVGRENANAGVMGAFGRALTAVYNFEQADCIVSLDAHFLADEPGSVRYAREFAYRRRLAFKEMGPGRAVIEGETPQPGIGGGKMSRLYVAESSVTFTGARADHRLPVKAWEIGGIAALIADPSATSGQSEGVKAWARAVSDDLRGAGKRALVIVGENQPPEVHALGHLLNGELGAIGTTVRYIEQVEIKPPDRGDSSLHALVNALQKDDVDLLLILDCNAAYNAPGDVAFGKALERFSNRPGCVAINLCTHLDETAELCRWNIPLSHALEAWGDCRGHDGTASIVQPLIEPLYASKSVVEFLGAVRAVGEGTAVGSMDGYEIVREYWFNAWGGASAGEKEMRWRKSLHSGVVPESAFPEVSVTSQHELAAAIKRVVRKNGGGSGAGIELNFRCDPSVWAGAWANNPWLQELPKPLTRLTWDNAAIMSAATATRLGLDGGAGWGHESRDYQRVVRISTERAARELPVWIQAGQPDDTITVYLGGGRRRGGGVAEGVGVDVYPLRANEAGGGGLWQIADVRVEGVARVHQLACTQNHQVMDGRDIVRERSVAHLPGSTEDATSPDLYSTKKDKDGSTVHLSLYDEYKYEGYKWGMVIDLSACVGCNACVIACQAENNIPVVGKEQVLRGREMHWIRIDAYYGSEETKEFTVVGANPKMLFQPMLCQHCEDAPCEVVCPVEATSHSDEGLNEMTYNRCVGTRYCSNNCPYKVRRFNFFQYNDQDGLTLNMQKNPNVTIRSRGVMEKCTYCVQRINMGRIDGKREWARNDAAGRPTELRTVKADGWVRPETLPRLRVMTACQQACPTEAIIFGDMNDTQSLVYLLKTKAPWAAIDYGVLEELNTQPRTSYLERLSNPNPALAPSKEAKASGRPA